MDRNRKNVRRLWSPRNQKKKKIQKRRMCLTISNVTEKSKVRIFYNTEFIGT